MTVSRRLGECHYERLQVGGISRSRCRKSTLFGHHVDYDAVSPRWDVYAPLVTVISTAIKVSAALILLAAAGSRSIRHLYRYFCSSPRRVATSSVYILVFESLVDICCFG